MAGIGNVYDPLRYAQKQWEQGANHTTNATGEASSETEKPQTLEEFKAEIYATIDRMFIHPSQSRTQISISISDKAFEKMLNDPESKKQVLAVLQRDLGGEYPPSAAPAYSCLTIDDDCEYRGSAMGSAYGDVFKSRSNGSFWEKNTSKATSNYNEFTRKNDYERMDEKRLAEKYALERLTKVRELDQALQDQSLNRAIQKEKVLKQYENNMITIKS